MIGAIVPWVFVAQENHGWNVDWHVKLSSIHQGWEGGLWFRARPDFRIRKLQVSSQISRQTWLPRSYWK